LTDGDPETYWESDGSQGQHWIMIRMKKGTIIKYVTSSNRKLVPFIQDYWLHSETINNMSIRHWL